jgi:hypothetical protein
MLGRAQTQAIGHEKRYCFFLRSLEDERNSFCTLTVKEMDEGRLAMGKRLGRSATAARAASDSALAQEIAPAAVVKVGDPSPSVESAQEASAR